MSFGFMLGRERRRCGLTQAGLADLADISTRHLSFLEGGRSRPSLAMARRLAEALALDEETTEVWLNAAGYAVPRASVAHLRSTGLTDATCWRSGFEAALAVQDATCAAEAVRAAAKGMETLGLHRFATGTLRRGEDGAHQALFDEEGRPALAWMLHYRRQGYGPDDPLVLRTATAHAAFVWDEVEPGSMSSRGRAIIAEASDFGIRGGFVLPVQRADRTVRALTSWSTDRIDRRDQSTRMAATLIAAALLEAQERFEAREEPADQLRLVLSPLQRSVLGWISSGRSLEWIAQRLSRSETEALMVLREASRDLGCDDPWQAATRSVALGLL